MRTSVMETVAQRSDSGGIAADAGSTVVRAAMSNHTLGTKSLRAHAGF